MPVLEAVPQNAHGQSANIPLTTGRNQVCHRRTIRARVFAAISLEQPVLEDVRPLRDAPLGQAYGFDSMGGDVRESAVPGFQLSGLQSSKQTTCICRRKFAYPHFVTRYLPTWTSPEALSCHSEDTMLFTIRFKRSPPSFVVPFRCMQDAYSSQSIDARIPYADDVGVWC